MTYPLAKLKDIGESRSGATPSRAKQGRYFTDGQTPWVKTLDLNNGYISVTDEKVTAYAIKETSLTVHPVGTILIAMYGGYNQIGRTGLLTTPATTNQAISAVRLDHAKVDSYYALQALITYRYLWRRYAASSRKDPNITREDVDAFKIPLPPLPTQRRIAAILQTWDRAIALAERQLTDLQERKRGLMQVLLTGEKRLPEFEGAGEWTPIAIGKLLKEVKRQLVWDDAALYELVSIRRRSGGIFDREPLYGHQILTKTLKPIAEDDFLISKMQIVRGASCRVPKDAHGKMASGSYLTMRVRDPQSHDIRFLDYLSRTAHFYHQTYVSSYGVHIEKMTFDAESWKKQKQRFPSLREQEAIVSVLLKEELGIRHATLEVKSLQVQKKGLMQRLLSGEVTPDTSFDYVLNKPV